MFKKLEIILNEIGKNTINELLEDNKPINYLTFREIYFRNIHKHPERDRLLGVIRSEDYNYKFFVETLQNISKYIRELRDIIPDIINHLEENYPFTEKDYKKEVVQLEKTFKKLFVSSEDEVKIILNLISKFIKKVVSDKELEAKAYELTRSYNIEKLEVILDDIADHLKKEKKSKKSLFSFLSDENKSKISGELYEELYDIIRLFVKNIDFIVTYDSSLENKIKELEALVDNLSSMDNTIKFKKIIKEIFFKVEFIKNSVEQEKEELKDIILLMADSFKDFLGESDEYGQKLEEYIAKIKETDDINEIKKIKYNIIQATMIIKDKTDSIKKQLVDANSKISDIKQRLKKLEKELEISKEKILYDSLTGAYNRAVFEDRIKKEIENALRKNTSLYLLMLDIDFFKKINDTYGHQTGDMVLKILGAQIQKVIREVDFFARYGGEEFVILIPDVSEEKALEIAERIRKKIELTKFIYKKETLKVTISIGITKFKEEDSVESFLKRADEALYEAKRKGRNRVIFL